MSHYDTLKITETASQDDIKKAYRRLASKHHPDKGGSKDDFQRIEEAYRVLSNPERREQYDMERRGFGGGTRFHWNQDTNGMPDLDDVFAQFGFQTRSPFGNQRHQHPRRNKDLRITIELPLKDTLSPQTKTVSIRTNKGSEMVNINIPRGVDNDTVIKYPGLGDDLFASLSRGDLLVHFQIVPDSRFQRQGNDLVTLVEIDCFDAILGGEAEVESIDGTKFLISIPQGCQPGTKLRIKGQGLYRVNAPERGNLLIEISVKIPTTLTDEQIKLIKTIKGRL